MNEAILNTENQAFISENLDAETTTLLFKKAPSDNVSIKELVEQIEAKKRCKTKLPTWYKTVDIYYPNKLNIEQTSSELTAQYKSELVSGNSLIDLTGGFGVDCYYFSKQINRVVHCEINPNLSEIVSHNFKLLQANNITTIATDGLKHLKTQETPYNWVYVDPSRRHDSKGKVFFLKDCLPNVPNHLDSIFEKTTNLLIKTSPLLDISSGIKELQFVKDIHIVAVNNEVKELLWVLEKDYQGSINIKTCNIYKTKKQHFNFELNSEINQIASYSLPLKYLYEPNAAILKSGAFKSISVLLKLHKLHQHTHLYTHTELIDFPGRRFEIVSQMPFNKKAFKKSGIRKANIATRNFPVSVSDIRKKLQISDGGEQYIFFVTNEDNHRIALICKKVNT
ncbi:class I SAM-dependent methyltransferase [Bizionia sp. KMM 8389]